MNEEEVAEEETGSSCNPVPLKQWMKEDDAPGKECRPCVLSVGMSWYHSELTERGLTDLAQELEGIKDTGDPEEVASVMDEIKDRVPDEVKTRLLEFDCSMQVNAPLAAAELDEE